MKALFFSWLLGILCVSGSVDGACLEDLGNKVPDKKITASSSLNKNTIASFARQDGKNAWCSASNDLSPFLQIELNEDKKITEIVTQGSRNLSRWVTQFRVKYYKEGKWKTYVKKDGTQDFDGNQSRERLKINPLDPPIVTTIIRIYPKRTGSVYKQTKLKNVTCLRLGFYGCSAPVDGGWGIWGNWSECSVTCGVGFRSRERKCDSPVPKNGGKPCNDSGRLETIDCIKPSCKVDGGWGRWSDWTDCNRTCGIGMKSRTRKCDSPKPQNGGRECDKNEGVDIKLCRKRKCPENEIYAGYSGSGEGWVMHSGGGMNSAGSEDRRPDEWEEHSGKIPFELMYGDDEDYS
ncbi:uncharacterized protein [Porites lutea]|uniref:uncharacterized protein isoform X2 n=1 Tax=Porites lutea TaxID=51062 RepID=UPI003CC559B4